MLYNVAQLLKASVGTDLRAPIEGTVELNSDDIAILEPVSGDVRLQRTNQGVLATGEFATSVQLECVRCLEPFQLPMQVAFSEMFVPTLDVVTGQAMPRVDEDDVFPIDAHHHLNLAEPIRQQIILEAPMQPLCREDCGGLCPVCGKNRNVDPCNCEQEEDVRWSALTDLTLDFANETSEN